MAGEHQAVDNRSRLGFGLGVAALIGGLAIGATPLARRSGLGISPAIAADALHLQARVELIGGCLLLALALLWAMGRPRSADRLRSLVTATMLTGLASAALAVCLNWAIVVGRVADHMALIPAILDLVAAGLYAVTIVQVVSRAEGPLAMAMLLHSGAAWLLAYAGSQFTYTAGRVFLDNDKLLWFFDTPTMEMALLGFLVPTGLGLALGQAALAARSRALLRSLPLTLQATNLCILLWVVLRIWCSRYPGGYQQLVLALVGLGLFACVMKIVSDSAPASGWWRAGGKGTVIPLGRDDCPQFLAMLFLGIAAALLAVGAIIAAGLGSAPPRELFAAVVLALTVGFFATLTSGLLGMSYVGQASSLPAGPPSPRLWRLNWKPASRLLAVACWCVAAGVGLSMALWLMSTVVERSLAGLTLGAEVGLGFAVVVLLAWLWGAEASGE